MRPAVAGPTQLKPHVLLINPWHPDLHIRVRQELAGTSTCTGLSDLLRSVADAEALIRLVVEA